MVDDDGNKLTDKELLQEAFGHMGEALCFLYEVEDRSYQALAFMVDSCIKLATVLINEDNILSASADYTAYEEELIEKLEHKNLRVIK